MKFIKKIISVVFAAAILVSAIGVTAEPIRVNENNGETEPVDLTVTPGNGSCGDNMEWTLDENGTLTISGIGKMYDYYDEVNDKLTIPWFEKNNPAAIQKVEIEEGVESISAHAFAQTSITYVTLPESVKKIGIGLFGSCPNLSEVKLSDNIKRIPEDTFISNESLTQIIFPSNLTSIGTQAFEHCTKLEEIKLPETVESIEDYAFYDCPNIKEVFLPDGLKKIGKRNFSFFDLERNSNLPKQQKIYIPQTVMRIDDAAFNETSIIYGFKDSQAEKYAKKNNIEFTEVTESLYKDYANSEKEETSKPTVQVPTDENVINDLYNFKIIADMSDIRPDDNVTRAEAIKMLCIAGGNDVFEGSQTEEQFFSDVPTTHWAAKYIEIGAFSDIISGYDDGTFRPNNNVTYTELQKMIVSLLGFDLYAQNSGGYPNGYLLYAANLGINNDLTFDNDAYVTRSDAMRMIYNALDAPLMDVQRMIKEGVEAEPIVTLYDGGSHPFRSFRMILNGEAEYLG